MVFGAVDVAGSITKSGKKLFDPCTDHDSGTTIAELTTHYTHSQLFRNGCGSVVCDNNCWDRLGMVDERMSWVVNHFYPSYSPFSGLGLC
jgi:hypothetical protein